MSVPSSAQPPSRVAIEDPRPLIDCGRYAVKACVGDRLEVSALIFRDGAQALAAVARYRGPSHAGWRETPMRRLPTEEGEDRWGAHFVVDEQGLWRWSIEAWTDEWGSWRDELDRKVAAGVSDLDSELAEGAALLRATATRAASVGEGDRLAGVAALLEDSSADLGDRTAAALAGELAQICARHAARFGSAQMSPAAIVEVERERARFGSWYELFPRSFGGFSGVAEQLPRLASLGFDVVYLPPIHPIGATRRKGRNNALVAGAADPGSPWAIGSAEGGHKAVNPELGALEDFDRLVAAAADNGIEIALDYAIQCSADHPWLSEHPEWFNHRPDGTLKYAENPPKRYEDIYNVNFGCDDWRGLWAALLDIVEFWVDRGVRVFRVDNPHTKPFAFWKWLIEEVRGRRPDVIFLAEAFTRPAPLRELAKLGFSQSYTYFPWRNAKYELTAYLTELAQTPVREFFRPNQWPNTPDILTEFLQIGSRAAFMIRFLLAATLGANYGIYGPAFELLESRPLRAGSEEYLDSEKYQIRYWDLGKPDSLRELIALVNRIRHENPALQSDWQLNFHPVDNEQLICYSKRSQDGTNLVVMVVNLDPHHTQSGFVELPLDEWKIEEDRPYQANDLLTGARYVWSGRRNYVEINPASVPGHIFRIRRRLRVETDFEYFL